VLPNSLVILWNNKPTKVIYYSPKRFVLIKCDTIKDVTFFSTIKDAQDVIDCQPIEKNLIIKEIQFRIMDSINKESFQ